jgi:DNA modification methylase
VTPWLDDGDVRLYHGDNLDVLRTLPDKSVHMCATSPPFYGLRDYGTGEWEGGQPGCDHRKIERGASAKSGLNGSLAYKSGEVYTPFGHECGKCGARRVDKQIGLEETPDQWVENLVRVFREVRRVLRDDGTLWVEIGDSYTSVGGGPPGGDIQNGNIGSHSLERLRRPGKAKDLVGQPWLLAFALRADGWWLRSEIIWARPNPMPESVTDRPTKSHSTVFLLSKSPRYFYDADAIREPFAQTLANGAPNPRAQYPGGLYPNEKGGNRRDAPDDVRTLKLDQAEAPSGANARSVWTIPTQPTPFAHFATWPEALCRRMILAGCPERVCVVCGTPSERIVEREFVPTQETDNGRRYDPADEGRWKGKGKTDTTTVGWSECECVPIHTDETCPRLIALRHAPSYESMSPPRVMPPCSCPKWQPGVVLDPFAGSATTNLVARNHGRHSIGIELNEDYLKIAAKRLQQLSLLA